MENLELTLDELRQISSNKKSEELREKLRLHARKLEIEKSVKESLGKFVSINFNF